MSGDLLSSVDFSLSKVTVHNTEFSVSIFNRLKSKYESIFSDRQYNETLFRSFYAIFNGGYKDLESYNNFQDQLEGLYQKVGKVFEDKFDFINYLMGILFKEVIRQLLDSNARDQIDINLTRCSALSFTRIESIRQRIPISLRKQLQVTATIAIELFPYQNGLFSFTDFALDTLFPLLYLFNAYDSTTNEVYTRKSFFQKYHALIKPIALKLNYFQVLQEREYKTLINFKQEIYKEAESLKVTRQGELQHFSELMVERYSERIQSQNKLIVQKNIEGKYSLDLINNSTNSLTIYEEHSPEFTGTKFLKHCVAIADFVEKGKTLPQLFYQFPSHSYNFEGISPLSHFITNSKAIAEKRSHKIRTTQKRLAENPTTVKLIKYLTKDFNTDPLKLFENLSVHQLAGFYCHFQRLERWQNNLAFKVAEWADHPDFYRLLNQLANDQLPSPEVFLEQKDLLSVTPLKAKSDDRKEYYYPNTIKVQANNVLPLPKRNHQKTNFEEVINSKNREFFSEQAMNALIGVGDFFPVIEDFTFKEVQSLLNNPAQLFTEDSTLQKLLKHLISYRQNSLLEHKEIEVKGFVYDNWFLSGLFLLIYSHFYSTDSLIIPFSSQIAIELDGKQDKLLSLIDWLMQIFEIIDALLLSQNIVSTADLDRQILDSIAIKHLLQNALLYPNASNRIKDYKTKLWQWESHLVCGKIINSNLRSIILSFIVENQVDSESALDLIKLLLELDTSKSLLDQVKKMNPCPVVENLIWFLSNVERSGQSKFLTSLIIEETNNQILTLDNYKKANISQPEPKSSPRNQYRQEAVQLQLSLF